jgi:hypothetical protein|tara:strand:+ start:3782 stop:4039 length:258 start_codon:yes stop_codon:yes gene_type:complete
MYKQQPKSPLMKALIGNQKNLPEALKKKILEAPESAAKMYDKSPAKMKDLSGDGKVTKKDVLIGRGVLKADGSPAKNYKKGYYGV